MEPLSSTVYRSILYPALVFGVPRKAFTFLGITTLAMVFSLGQFWFLVITFIALVVARQVSKQDRYAFEIYTQLLKMPKELD